MKIMIRSAGVISALGAGLEETAKKIQSGKAFFSPIPIGNDLIPVSKLGADSEILLSKIIAKNRDYRHLDRSVLMAIAAARQLDLSNADSANIAVSIGSSRGATGLWEQHHASFLKGDRTSPFSSPTTTLGNVSSWVMHDLGLSGPGMGHSVTCSTTLQSLANGMAWLRSGMASRFIAGGTEAPLTPFTLAQMSALKVTAKGTGDGFPCKPLAISVQPGEGMVLGEGAAMFLLEADTSLNGRSALAVIESVGLASEHPSGFTAMSPEGDCLKRAMESALDQAYGLQIDLIILHAPGTGKGDRAELAAIQHVFGQNTPAIYMPKWQTGHLLGASAGLSLAMAINILHGHAIPDSPYPTLSTLNAAPGNAVKRIMVNAAGFGGNAGSVIVSCEG